MRWHSLIKIQTPYNISGSRTQLFFFSFNPTRFRRIRSSQRRCYDNFPTWLESLSLRTNDDLHHRFECGMVLPRNRFTAEWTRLERTLTPKSLSSHHSNKQLVINIMLIIIGIGSIETNPSPTNPNPTNDIRATWSIVSSMGYRFLMKTGERALARIIIYQIHIREPHT